MKANEIRGLTADELNAKLADLKNPFGGRNDRRRNDRGPRGERRGRQDRPERKEGGN